MKPSTFLAVGLASLPQAIAWGGFGHITVAYIASDFVLPETASYFQTLLRNDSSSYLAGVATWADSIRYTKWGHFTGIFHFIDAKDSPPSSCTVDFERDCKEEGCVVTAIANYTSRLLDPGLPAWERAQAAKFVVHFVGDIHQPLHTEDVARGGNGISVRFDGTQLNLHHVWDSSIAEKIVGGVRRAPYAEARRWADELSQGIRTGKFEALRGEWLDGVRLEESQEMALAWAREGNAFVCSHVLPEGPEAIVGQELGGKYFDAAAPVIELQVAKAGYRLAAWLDLVAKSIAESESDFGHDL
ncbi:nuclease S1 [Coniochaeta ligniaria NRRL 30616]|uniref:Nuclease S1 n=1 Tax=Coniochaeta ligniaria NRRL 30616 TaxID=1408157 RepID=A0A1J7IW48_9PEZI|nr:nuclease S1 [Coniochaeta ligniaria NRRL 30616]